MKKLAIVSLRFTPGKIGDLLSYYYLYRDLGYQTFILADKMYAKFIGACIDMVISIEEALNENPDISIIHNASPLNIKYIFHQRRAGKKVVYVLHEPYPGIRGMLREGFKFLPIATCRMVLEYWACILSDAIFLPSEQSISAYKKHAFINQNHYEVGLSLCDSETPLAFEAKRKYFSFTAGFRAVHGTKNFNRFLQYVFDNDIDILIKIATRDDLSNFIKQEHVDKLIKDGRLTVFHGTPMTSEEINTHYIESICIWNLYTQSMQSGVTGNAFMTGTPVLASRVGSLEKYVIDGKTGFFVNDLSDFEKIIEFYNHCKENQAFLAKNCREAFFEKFHYSAHLDLFKNAIERIC